MGIVSWNRKALAVGVVIAAAAIAVAGCGGGYAGEPASQTVAVVTSEDAASSDRVSDTDLAQAGTSARSQARRYERTAARISRLDVEASQDGARLRLLAALRQAATSYRVAGAAAESGDVSVYSSALVAAGESRQSVQRALSHFRVRASAPAASASSGQGATNGWSAPARPCAGDSVSDDPSDDSCDP